GAERDVSSGAAPDVRKLLPVAFPANGVHPSGRIPPSFARAAVGPGVQVPLVNVCVHARVRRSLQPGEAYDALGGRERVARGTTPALPSCGRTPTRNSSLACATRATARPRCWRSGG